MKTLIIEDNSDVAEAVSLCIQLRWPDAIISTAIEGLIGMNILKSEQFNIVILDLNLPDIDGFDVLKQVRSFSNIPIIILTVRGMEEEQSKGLEMGADDYIVKPFRPRDLVARVNSVLRRTIISEANTQDPFITSGKLTLNLANNEVRIGSEVVKLTPNECKILYILMTNPGQTLSGERLMENTIGKGKGDIKLVRTYIRRLRDKLEDKPPSMILNERGEGYRFITPK